MFPSVHLNEKAPQPEASIQYALRSLAYLARMGYSTLALGFHVELERRARSMEEPPASASAAAAARAGAGERFVLLREQARREAVRAAHEVGKGMRELPSLAHATHFPGFRAHLFAEVLLREVDITGQLEGETVTALES